MAGEWLLIKSFAHFQAVLHFLIETKVLSWHVTEYQEKIFFSSILDTMA